MKRFLLAHPDVYTRHTLEAAIGELGYEVEIIQDGLDVVDRTLDDKPDAIVLGLALPGIGGLQIARTLRTLQTTQQLPILFVTDNAAESTRVLQAALAGVGCLQAPFDVARVREQLMRLTLKNLPAGPNGAPPITVEGLAITDPPTGLFSRNYILHRLAYEGARATRYRHDLSVVLIGVRNFDEIVKRHGQRGADHICMDIAGLIRRAVRMVDLIGRTATDQFLIILPETDQPGARACALRLCNHLETANFQAGETFQRVQICAGIAGVSRSNLMDNLALFANAEMALARARANSNLRVVEA